MEQILNAPPETNKSVDKKRATLQEDMAGSSQTGPQEQVEEIDLVDMIGFIWRWRLWYAVFISIGAAISLGVYFSQSVNSPHAPMGKWSLKLELIRQDGSPSGSNLAPFLTMLYSQSGQDMFRQKLIPQLPASIQDPMHLWLAQLASSQNKSLLLEGSGQGLVLHFDAKKIPPMADSKKEFESGFAALLQGYQDHFVQEFQELSQRKIKNLQLLGTLTYKSVNLFLTESQYSPELRKEFVTSLMAASQGHLSLDQVVTLLSTGIKDSLESQNLIAEFQKAQAKQAQTQNQVERYIKEFPPFGPMPLEGELKMSSLNFTPAQTKGTMIHPLIKSLLVSIFLAILFCTIVALICQFISNNRRRLSQTFNH